jgi:hypothetical protein
MVSGQNGSLNPNDGQEWGLDKSKRDELETSTAFNWTALPDLILTLIPTGILLISGSVYGKSTLFFKAKTPLATAYVISLLVIVVILSSTVNTSRPSGTHNLATIGSLVYSSVFPFTVATGGWGGCSTDYIQVSFAIACLTLWISWFNPKLATVALWTTPLALINAQCYYSTLLYTATFQAISNTAETSFNFEEVALISQAVTHTLSYASETNVNNFAPHEIFLPALTFGLMVAVSPAIPVLRKLKGSTSPATTAASAYLILIVLSVLCVWPWISAGLGKDPLIWAFNYITISEGFETRLAIVLWWLAVLAFGIIVPVTFFTAGSIEGDNGESLNKRRKFFHGIVVLLFLPALDLDVIHL